MHNNKIPINKKNFKCFNLKRKDTNVQGKITIFAKNKQRLYTILNLKSGHLEFRILPNSCVLQKILMALPEFILLFMLILTFVKGF